MLTEQQRIQILNNTIYAWNVKGWSLEVSQPPYAILFYKNKVNHWLHFFISLFTGGFWLWIWLILALTAGTTRRQIFIDEEGKVIQKKL